MRLVTWNIRAGGGTRLAKIAEALAAHQADVLILTEYRSGEAGQRLRAVLRDQGYVWLSPVEPPGICNGVLIATRSKPGSIAHVTEHVPEPWRMLTVTINRVRVFGIYMPNLKAKIPYWEALIEASRHEHLAGSLRSIGDLERILARIALRSARPRDLLQLRTSLGATPGLRTALAGFISMTWPTTSQSKSIRMPARCSLTEGAAIRCSSSST